MDVLADRIRRADPSRVCIIKPSSLGDIIHCLPILPPLRRLLPSAQITWVVNSSFRSLVEGHPDLDRVVTYQRGSSGLSMSGLNASAGLWRRLWSEHFDLTIDLQGLLRSGLMTAAARAPIRVGLADAREGARWFYTHLVDAQRLKLHAVDRAILVARALGADVHEPEFKLPITEAETQWARQALANVPRPRLVLNAGARWVTKRWPPEHFAAIARRAAAELGAGLVAVGSPDDRGLVRQMNRHVSPVPLLDLSGQTSLLQLAAIAREAELFLSNDTGPLHLAAAAGAHVVGLYTCTEPRLTGPYGPRTSTVRSGVWCAPSFRKSCDRLECLSELSPDRVWPTVRIHLSTAAAPVSSMPSIRSSSSLVTNL